MQDRQLYQQLLGIAFPWSVERVELKLAEGEVHVFLEHAPNTRWPCPECGTECPLHDHGPERVWRHLDTCQYQTLIHAAVPRTCCPQHGVHVASVPWAEPHSRFTAWFERLAIDWLQAASQQAVAKRLGLSWDEVHGIQERAVQRGLAHRQAEPIPRLRVDEKAFLKGHRYATVVTDLDRGRVLYVAPERKQTSLDGFWPTLTEAQRESIRAVAMDMREPYENSVRAHMLKKHLGGILTYLKHGITNAMSESLNAKIQWVKYTARGFRNFDNFRTAIYFHCGGLSLAPSPT